MDGPDRKPEEGHQGSRPQTERAAPGDHDAHEAVDLTREHADKDSAVDDATDPADQSIPLVPQSGVSHEIRHSDAPLMSSPSTDRPAGSLSGGTVLSGAPSTSRAALTQPGEELVIDPQKGKVPPVKLASQPEDLEKAANKREKKAKRRRVVAEPPRAKRTLVAAWFALLLVLGIASAPLGVELGTPGVIGEVEAEVIAASTRVWERVATPMPSTQSVWSVTRYLSHTPEGVPRLSEPHGLTWMHLLAARGLDPGETDAATFRLRMRCVSVAAALLVVASVFWCGFSIGGLKTACFASLVCIANPVFIFYGRAASPAMPQLAWIMLSLAAAIWAIRPLKPRPSLFRQVLGWGLAGVSLAAAILTAGALAFGPVAAPLFVVILLCPHRMNHLTGLLAMLIIACLGVTPWAIYVHSQDPTVYQAWMDALVPVYVNNPTGFGMIAGIRALLVLAALAPWVPWLIAAYVQPFSVSSTGSRSRMFIGWAWCHTIVVLVLAAPGDSSMLAAVTIIPAASIVVGQVIRQYSDLSAEGRHARFWRIMRWPTSVTLVPLALLIPALLWAHPYLREMGVFAEGYDMQIVAPMAPLYWIGVASSLLLTAALGMRFAVEQHPGRAAITWATWLILAMVLLMIPFARGPLAAGKRPAASVTYDGSGLETPPPQATLPPAPLN